MNEPRQEIMLALGEGGCYFLSLVHIGESLHGDRRIDAVEKFLEAQKLNLCRPDCYILDPAGIMKLLYDAHWYYHKEDAGYHPLACEFEILRYEHPTPKVIYSHFVVGDGKDGVAYDPLGESETVAQGTLQSKRILRLVIENV
jgi:hypothetical protein